VLGIQPRCGLRGFEVEGQPLLNALHARTLGEI
jgi:hypothetical protein